MICQSSLFTFTFNSCNKISTCLLFHILVPSLACKWTRSLSLVLLVPIRSCPDPSFPHFDLSLKKLIEEKHSTQQSTNQYSNVPEKNKRMETLRSKHMEKIRLPQLRLKHVFSQSSSFQRCNNKITWQPLGPLLKVKLYWVTCKIPLKSKGLRE